MGKIRLIQPDEEYQVNYGTMVVKYKRMTPMQLKQVLNKHTENGVIDSLGFNIEFLQECTKSWSGVYGQDDEEITYHRDLWPQLTEDVIASCSLQMRKADPVEEQLGN